MEAAVATKTIEPIRRAFPAEKAKAWHYKPDEIRVCVRAIN